MKKLALLLAALGVMSATAFAEQPTLKVTSIGQEVEIENTSGNEDVGEKVWFKNKLDLSYDNWTFNVVAGKIWNMDTDKGIHSADHRVELTAMRKMNDNYSLGFRYRGHKDYDRYVVRGTWNYNMIWGSADIWYQANNGSSPAKEDNFEMELFPVGVQYNGVKLGYLLNYGEYINPKEDGQENFVEHQLRFYAPLYKGEKLTLQTEIRHTLHADKEYEKKTPYKAYDDFGRTRVYLKSDYKINDALNVFLNYAYEFREWDSRDGKVNTTSDKYYGNLLFGWKYKF